MENSMNGARLSPLPSVSKSLKPHRFFERTLDNDLEELTAGLKIRYDLIEQAKIAGVTPVTEADIWRETNSVSTMKWRQYNVFQFYLPGLRKLYSAIGDMAREACEYYGIDFEEQQYMIQGWFNISQKNATPLNWHEHGAGGAPLFHGYYCVNAEPSTTHYLAFDEYKENVNINNRAVLSEMGHPHAVDPWFGDEPRITVAYDLVPVKNLAEIIPPDEEQHWTPFN